MINAWITIFVQRLLRALYSSQKLATRYTRNQASGQGEVNIVDIYGGAPKCSIR